MRTIVVSGAMSGVGKTHMAEQLLAGLPGWSALKVTVAKEGPCPHHSDCGVCPDVAEPFHVIKDEGVINQPGKDTARLKAAGAKEVIWLKARPEGLKDGLNAALAEFSDCEGVVVEGTSALKYLKPTVNIHIQYRGVYSII